MANINHPFGLRTLGYNLGGGQPLLEEYTKDATYAKAIFPGDAVNVFDDGNLETSATPGTTAYSGVALNYGAPTTLSNHLVIVSPNAMFVAQDDGDSDTFEAADRGLNANLVLTAGSTVTLQSQHEVNIDTLDVTATLDVKLHRLWNVPDNAYGANARIEISFNKHRNAHGVVGI